MPSGHIQDPRMKADEKEFGLLVISSDSESSSNQIIYLKDDVCRYYKKGTLVTFEIEKRRIVFEKPTVITKRKDKAMNALADYLATNFKLVVIEVATKVRAIDTDKEANGNKKQNTTKFSKSRGMGYNIPYPSSSSLYKVVVPSNINL